MTLETFLEELGIRYDRYEHPAVFTCDEARQWVPDMLATPTKNLFLRDRKGRRHFLVVVGYEKSVDLRSLAHMLEVDRLLLGSERRLQQYLGVSPGSVTLLALMNDLQNQVEVVLDEPIAQAPQLRCHPLVNTATLALQQEAIRRFLQATGHTPRVLDVPAI